MLMRQMAGTVVGFPDAAADGGGAGGLRTGSRCHRRDVELAESSEDVIDWLLVHRTGSYSAKDTPGLRPARLRSGRHWMLRRHRPPRHWSTLRGPPPSR